MKSLSTFFRLIDDHKIRIFKVYTWIIPIGIISFILISLLRSYTFCKIKQHFDLKFISVSKIFLVYGFFGFLICFIISIIPTIFPCSNNNTFEKIICTVKNIDNNNNSTTYYYDNYYVYFKDLWKKEEIYYNILFIFIVIFKIILSFLIKLFSILIIKNLSPEYLICSNSIFYFITESIDSIASLIIEKFKYYKLFDILDELFSILGTIFYLELIEFKFCGLNYNFKKNIKIRSIKETNTKISNSSIIEEDK